MQMYAVVATGVLGLLIGFWLGRSIRWNMEETEEAVNRQEETAGYGRHRHREPGERRDQENIAGYFAGHNGRSGG